MPEFTDARFTVKSTSRAAIVEETKVMSDLFKADMIEYGKQERKLQQCLELVANDMQVACTELLMERIETQMAVEKDDYQGDPFNMRDLILLHAGAADPRKSKMLTWSKQSMIS